MYLCATPIGNLEDITIRVLKTLRAVDLVAAEDTRRTGKLLARYKIKAPLTSYHEHNEKVKAKELLRLLKEGKNIALVSDAGTPGLSDPGYRLIKVCLEEEIPLEILPGPSAAIAALVISGLPTASFVFQGFLPRKKGKREKILLKLADEERTIVLYESPYRIASLLKEILEIMGNRRVVLARELTKKYQEIIRGGVTEVFEYTQRQKLPGEMVLVIEGKLRPKRVKGSY